MSNSFWRVAKGQPYGSEPLERCRLSTVTHSCPCSAIRNAPLALLMPTLYGKKSAARWAPRQCSSRWMSRTRESATRECHYDFFFFILTSIS